MADAYVLQSSNDLPETEFDFARKDFVWVVDSNNGSYSSGQIVIDLASIANAGDKYLNWKESTLIVPIVLSLQSSAKFTDTASNAYSASLLNGVHQLVNSVSLQLANNEVISVQSFNNILTNFKILSSFSTTDVENFGASMLFAKDSAGSFNFDATTGTVNGLGLSNNVIVGASGQSTETFAPATAGASTSMTFNEGRARRMQYSATNAVDAHQSNAIIQPAVLSTVLKNNVAERTTSLITYHITAELPMRFLHDYFMKCPLAKNSYYRLVVTSHLPSSATLVTAITTGLYTNASTVTTPFGVCPFQVSPMSSDGSTGLGMSLTASNTFTVRCGIASVPGALAHPLSSCRLYCALNTFTPIYQQLYLKNPVKKLVYNDYLSYNTITNIASGGNVNSLISPNLSRLRSMYVFPFLSATSNGASGLTQLNSPWDNAPSVCCPYAYITNINVQLSGINLYQENKNYRFSNFLEEIRSKNSINGGLLTGISSGLIDEHFYNTSYPVVVFDLSRKNAEEDDISRSILLQFVNASKLTMSYIVIVEYEKEINLNVEIGSIVL